MNTLLESFVDIKKNQHQEPARTKVPRGQRIGISKVKYEAALICALCNFDLKGLAKHLNGSYEVIRRWKTENDFKSLCNCLQHEFAKRIDLELESITKELQSQPLQEDMNITKQNYVMFSDAYIYSSFLIEHIESKLKRLLKMPNGYLFYDMAKAIAEFSGSHQLTALLRQAENNLRDSIIDKAIEALENPETAQLETREVINYLKLLKGIYSK